ncbi:MAG: hypothetical protein K2I37_05890 [Muribaculaceae bacterium]|nr:hypothetical protein [Muribaculaceae bacterium]
MSKNKNTKSSVPADLESITPAEVKGLTIREIRYQRALVALQKDFCREKMNVGILRLKNSSPFSKNYQGKSKPFGRAAGIVGKLIGGMNYLDYAVLGFSIFSNVRKVMGIFRKK